jgi:hypothetical protein
MSILNRPSDGLLSVLLALQRALIAFGAQPEADLLELVAPPSVVPDGKPDMAKKTLTRWKQLGFFTQIGDLVGLSPKIATITADDLDSLRPAILRLVLAPENNSALLGDGADDQEGSRSSDCTRALAWVLAQDPYSFPATYKGVESLQDDQGVQPSAFANDTRWAGFAEWSVFLGAAWTTSKVGIVPDPAFAVRSVLMDLFVDNIELPQADFFTRLADRLPIIDGGRYRIEVEAQIARPWRNQLSNEVSPSLSAALLTLEAAGKVRLETRSDAPTRILLGRAGREIRPISHAIRLEAM